MNWFVELPGETKIQIGILVMAALNLVLEAVISYVPWLQDFIAKYKQEWAIALTAWLTVTLENALPDAYPDISVLAVQLGVAVLLALLVKVFLANRGVKAFNR